MFSRKVLPLALLAFYAGMQVSDATVPAQITLTTGQVDSIIAQQGGTPPVPGPIPPIPPGNIVCSGFTNTIVINLIWDDGTPIIVPMTLNEALVLKFTTGNNASTNNLPSITGTEYGSNPSQRTAVLSSTPCVFTSIPGQPPGHYIVGTTVTALFAVAGPGFNFYPVLAKNTTYYLNVKNNLGSGCLPDVSCQMRWNLSTPGI